jgi:5-methylcytosine-specific restriction endonuclease McrA
MSRILVVDAERSPLMPTTPARARLLLKSRKAAVLRHFPLVLILKDARPAAAVEPLRVKLDPGSNTSGIAVVNDQSGEVVWAAELTHRGAAIRGALTKRRAARRARRQRKTRYRAKRFLNRRRPQGWLAPSFRSRVQNLLTWVTRLSRWCPVGAISQELTRFDTQALQDPTIAGIQYQQGTLAGYEIRAYLLEKWHRRCAYCQQSSTKLQVEHLVPRSRGGSSRISNVVLACEGCNLAKGNRTAQEFGFSHLMAQAKVPLVGAAVMNATRWRLYRELQAMGKPLEVGTGGRTSYHRAMRQLPKTHWIDAALVGASTPEQFSLQHVRPWQIEATGWQSRQMCLMSKHGFPRTRAKQHSRVKGFRTGDLARAVVKEGAKAGSYQGRVAVRASGSFNLTTEQGTVEGIHVRWCRLLQQKDGYRYQQRKEAAFPPAP